MAKKDMKAKYQGHKLAGDNAEQRKREDMRRDRAEKNAAGRQTNDVFASSDTEFREACDKAGVQPTARQASKFRHGYGLAARAAGISNRRDPRA